MNSAFGSAGGAIAVQFGGSLTATDCVFTGNSAQGAVYAVDAQDNVVHAPDATVVLYGVSNLVVVVEKDLVLVTTVSRSADLKTLMETLPQAVRERE